MKKSVTETVQKEMPEFASEVAALESTDLNARLAQLAKDLVAVSDAQEGDDGLADAKANATELGAPYRDAKKTIRLKSRYLVQLLKVRGES